MTRTQSARLLRSTSSSQLPDLEVQDAHNLGRPRSRGVDRIKVLNMVVHKEEVTCQ